MNPFKTFKSYTGLHTTEDKLVMLLKEYTFTTCEEVLKAWFGVEDLAGVQAPAITPSGTLNDHKSYMAQG